MNKKLLFSAYTSARDLVLLGIPFTPVIENKYLNWEEWLQKHNEFKDIWLKWLNNQKEKKIGDFVARVTISLRGDCKVVYMGKIKDFEVIDLPEGKQVRGIISEPFEGLISVNLNEYVIFSEEDKEYIENYVKEYKLSLAKPEYEEFDDEKYDFSRFKKYIPLFSF